MCLNNDSYKNIAGPLLSGFAIRVFMNIKIYGIHLRTVESISCGYLMNLMPKRYARSQKYLRREDRMRCLGAGYLMHRVLGISENALQYGEYGKPFAPGRAEFSLSHGGSWAVLAADASPLGVDIEAISTMNLDVAKRVFTADELCWMQRDPLVRFHILWTIKESIMKATGLGMQLDPAQFDVLPICGPNRVHGKTWHTAWMLYDGCVLACASLHPIDNIVFEEVFPEKENGYV